MVEDEEQHAAALASRLHGITGELRRRGNGYVNVVTEARHAQIRCVTSGQHIRGELRWPQGGCEYEVMLFSLATRCASGRTPAIDEAISAAREWMAGAAIAGLESQLPFLNAMRHRLEALEAAIAPRIAGVAECFVDPDGLRTLTVRGERRICCVLPDDEGVDCKFSLDGVELASGEIGRAPADVVEAWMRGCALTELASHGIHIGPDAEMFERGEYLRWHWRNVLDAAAAPSERSRPARELIERLAQSPIATRFYTYRSLSIFCFTASSAFPWADNGLPKIHSPHQAGERYRVLIGDQMTECSLDEAVELTERCLAAYPVKPFWGAGDDSPG